MADKNPWRDATRAGLRPEQEQDTERDAHQQMGLEHARQRERENANALKQSELARKIADAGDNKD